LGCDWGLKHLDLSNNALLHDMEILSAALILVAAISIGFSCMFIARNRGSINKHSRQRIKDYENDIKYLGDINRNDAKEYREEITRLKGLTNRLKQGTEITKNDVNSSSGIGPIIMKLIPNKYQRILEPFIPKVESYLIEHPEMLGNIKDEILKANSKQAQVQPQAETTSSL